MDTVEQDIQNGDYNLVSKILYGGLFSGAIVIPTNFVKVILTLIFPPLGTILNIIGEQLLNHFPYITWDTLMLIFRLDNFNNIIYTFLLTSLFYVPGLVYTLSQLTLNSKETGYVIFDPDTGLPVPDPRSTTPNSTTPN